MPVERPEVVTIPLSDVERAKEFSARPGRRRDRATLEQWAQEYAEHLMDEQ